MPCSQKTRTKTWHFLPHSSSQPKPVMSLMHTESNHEISCRTASKRKIQSLDLPEAHLSRHHKAQHSATCRTMARVTGWARKIWETSLRRKLASNQMYPESMMTPDEAATWHGHIKEDPAPENSNRQSGIYRPNKAELMTTHFSGTIIRGKREVVI